MIDSFTKMTRPNVQAARTSRVLSHALSMRSILMKQTAL